MSGLRSVLLAVALLTCSPPVSPAQELSEAARWLRDYLEINTSNPPGNEHLGASYLADILHREGIETRLLVSPGRRTSLYARLPATQPNRGSIVLTHHIDVVPPGDGWTVDPFGGMVEDGRLWGRGAIDAKGLGIAQLAAFVELARSDAPREREVIFLAVADEERGGEEGMAWLFERHEDLFAGVDAVLNEGGSSRAIGDRVLWWEVEVAQKRPLWVEVRTRGRAGHAAGFNPQSATHKLLAALGRLLERPPRYRVTPPVRAYLAALSPLHSGGRYGKIFAEIDDWVVEEGPRTHLPPGLSNLFLDSIQITVVNAGDSINAVPGEASALIDIRLLPGTDSEAFLEELGEILGDRVEIEVLVTAPDAEPSPSDHPVYRAIADVLGESGTVVPAFMSGYTDSRHFRQRGIPAYGLIPFAVDPDDRRGVHAADERIPLVAFEAGVERVREILRSAVVPAD